MSEVHLPAPPCPSMAPVAGPQVRMRPSLTRKRPAAAGLRPISDLALTAVEPPRVPSALSSLSVGDLSADSGEDDGHQAKLLKRMRHDSGISLLSFDSDSQSTFSSPSEFSLGSSESSSSRTPHSLLTHNCRIGNFRIVGVGRESKCYHEETGEIFDARILTDAEYQTVSRVFARLEQAAVFYSRSDVEQMREAVLPAKTEVIEETSGRVVMFTPIFKKSVHSFAQERGVDVTELELQPMFEQIIKLLAFCHSIGIILRDLKPRKLVFDEEGRIRLHHVRDCVVLDDPSNDTVYEKFGSPAYVQPEVLIAGGAGYSGKAADMWSFGVLMYLLLLGRYPFFDKTPIGVLQKIMQARVSLPITSQLSKHARVLLYSLLRKCPEKRPTAEQLSFVPWGQAKNLPSRGSAERTIISRSFLNELLNQTAFEGLPLPETRPAVPLEGDRTASSPPASPDMDHLSSLVYSAQRLLNTQRSQILPVRTSIHDLLGH